MQVAALKNDCALFSRLYVSCQTRDGDLDTFFTHENQAAPPSLSVGGKLRLGTKADLPYKNREVQNACCLGVAHNAKRVQVAHMCQTRFLCTYTQ